MDNVVDPKLKAWSYRPEYIDAVNQYGSIRAAERALKVTNDVIGRSIRRAKKAAASKGYSPDHAMIHTVPDPYVVKGISTLYDGEGQVRSQWVKSTLDDERRMEILKEASEAFSQEIPRVDPIQAPGHTNADLANLYIFTDYHLGAYAWAGEGGEDWDLEIAERLLIKSLEQMVTSSPHAKVGILGQLGDFLHTDGLLPTTPTHGHVLDASGRFPQMAKAAVRCLRRMIDIMLMKHEQVYVLLIEGNHDIASSMWLREMFRALYENEPRVKIDDGELPYHCYQHGETMLGFHHGHMKKREALPLLFAAQYPKVWGNTTKRYVHCGHMHHERVEEHSGIKVIQHPTLAARDSHSSRSGYHSERQASCITYHTKHGKVGEVVVTPLMVA